MNDTLPEVYKVADLLGSREGTNTVTSPDAANTVHPPCDEQRRIIADDTMAKPFFGFEAGETRFEPAHVLQSERPEHRWICMLSARGYTAVEIQDETGFCLATINYVRKQPWALKYIAEMMDKCGRKTVMTELQGAALESARTLISTMKGEISRRDSYRAKAANEILDRLFGTATNVTVTGKVDVKDISTDELAAIALGKN